jgi:hypothetical protein
MVSELITLAQVLVAETTITFDYDDDEEDEVIAFMEFKSNSLPT